MMWKRSQMQVVFLCGNSLRYCIVLHSICVIFHAFSNCQPYLGKKGKYDMVIWYHIPTKSDAETWGIVRQV